MVEALLLDLQNQGVCPHLLNHQHPNHCQRHTQTSFIEISIEAGNARDPAKWEGRYSRLGGVTQCCGVVSSELVWHLGIISTHAVVTMACFNSHQLIVLLISARVCLAFRSRV